MYSAKWAAFRMPSWITRSSAGGAPGSRTARTGRMTAAVRSALNHPVDSVQITAAQTSAGAHWPSCSALRKLVDGTIHEREDLLAELGVDEALDLVALRGVTPATGFARERRPGEDVEQPERAGMRARIATRELAIERQPQGQVGEAVLRVFRELHRVVLSASARAGTAGPFAVLLDDEGVVVVVAIERALDRPAVEEDRRRRRDADAGRGRDVLADPRQRRRIVEADAEGAEVEAQLSRVAEQALAIEMLVGLEEDVEVPPEGALQPRALRA